MPNRSRGTIPSRLPGPSAADITCATLEVNDLPPLVARALTAEIISDLYRAGYFIVDEAAMRQHVALLDSVRTA